MKEERDFVDHVNTKEIEIGQLILPCNTILNWIGEIGLTLEENEKIYLPLYKPFKLK